MCREDIEGDDAADVAPVVAVGGNRHGGVVVADVFSGEERRPVREDDVVFGEAFLDDGG